MRYITSNVMGEFRFFHPQAGNLNPRFMVYWNQRFKGSDPLNHLEPPLNRLEPRRSLRQGGGLAGQGTQFLSVYFLVLIQNIGYRNQLGFFRLECP